MLENKFGNIEFRDDEEFCRWKGILLDPDTWVQTFGVEEELYFETPEGLLIGDILYTDDLRNLRGKHPEFNMNAVWEIKSMIDLSPVKLNLLKEFTKDLNNYYNQDEIREGKINQESLYKEDYKLYEH